VLFAGGVDKFATAFSGPTNNKVLDYAVKQTENQASGFFTRSFPILEVKSGYYGDNFHKVPIAYGHNEIDFDIGNDGDEGWIWGGQWDNPKEVLGKDWAFDIANGFYDGSGVPFPDELVLTGIGSTADETYTIQYQQALTLRVRLEVVDTDSAASDSNGYLPVSDTGVLFIYPRKEATGIIDDVDKRGKTKFGVAGGVDLRGGIRGVKGSGIVSSMEDGYWIEAHDGAAQGLDDDLFYDSLFRHEGDGGFEENTKQYGQAYDRVNPDAASLGGIMISSKDTLVNNQQVGFS
jgi:hypothetical protein